jgi:hypothetical protein
LVRTKPCRVKNLVKNLAQEKQPCPDFRW